MAAVCAEALVPSRDGPEGGDGEGEHPQADEMLEVLKMAESEKNPRMTSSLASSVLESLVSQETEDSSSDASGCDDVFLAGDRRASRSGSPDEGTFSGDDSASSDGASCPPDEGTALVLTPRPGKVRCLIESFTEISSRDDRPTTLHRKPRRSNVSGQSGKLAAALPVAGGEVMDGHGQRQRESDVREHPCAPEAPPDGAPITCVPAEGGKTVLSGGGGPAVNGDDPPPTYRQEASIVFKKVANQAKEIGIDSEPRFHLDSDKTADRTREGNDIPASINTPQDVITEQTENELNLDAFVSEEMSLAPEPNARETEIEETLISPPEAASDENRCVESENEMLTSRGIDGDQGTSEKSCEGGKTEGGICEPSVTKTGGSGNGTPVALMALCVAMLAIALSHPWSANLSSGIVAAAVFFSLSKLILF